MGLLFNNFEEWKKYCIENNQKLFEPVLQYEMEQKSRDDFDPIGVYKQIFKDVTTLDKDTTILRQEEPADSTGELGLKV